MPDRTLSGKGGLRECWTMAVMRSPVVSKDEGIAEIKNANTLQRIKYLTRGEVRTDQAV